MFFRALRLAMAFAASTGDNSSQYVPCDYPDCLDKVARKQKGKHWVDKHLGSDGRFSCSEGGCGKTYGNKKSFHRHFKKIHGKSRTDLIASNKALRDAKVSILFPSTRINPTTLDSGSRTVPEQSMVLKAQPSRQYSRQMGGSGSNDVPESSREGSERLDLGTNPLHARKRVRLRAPPQSTEPIEQGLLTPRGGGEANNIHPSFLPAGAGRISGFGTDVGSPAATGKTDPLIGNRNTNNPIVERRKRRSSGSLTPHFDPHSADGTGLQPRSSLRSSLLKISRNILGPQQPTIQSRSRKTTPSIGGSANTDSSIDGSTNNPLPALRKRRSSGSVDDAGLQHRLPQPSSLGHDAAMSAPEFDELLLPPQPSSLEHDAAMSVPEFDESLLPPQPSSLDHGAEAWLSEFDLSLLDR